jgi:predicted CoA-binding protein
MIDKKIKQILTSAKTIAMIGVSQDLQKTSTIVMKYMQQYGYKVIPVNPSAKGEKILGEKVFEKLSSIDLPVDIVNIFRPSIEAIDFAKDAVEIKAKVLWLQLGIENKEAKKLVEINNIYYVENKCTKIEYQKFFEKKLTAFPILQN